MMKGLRKIKRHRDLILWNLYSKLKRFPPTNSNKKALLRAVLWITPQQVWRIPMLSYQVAIMLASAVK
jgi:hypothetical protein